MATFEIDEITITDGDVVSLKKDDIILGMLADGTKFVVLRKIYKV